jgi:hypothetical protein
MDSTLLASLILGGAMIVAAVTLAFAFSRGGRSGRLPSPPAPSMPIGTPSESHEPHDSRRRDDHLRSALQSLARRIGRLEATLHALKTDDHHDLPHARASHADEEPPLSVHPPLPGHAAMTSPTSIREHAPSVDRSILIEPSPRFRRDREAIAIEVRRMLSRGRSAIEIAQMLDLDVGEVELVLQLDRASLNRESRRDD